MSTPLSELMKQIKRAESEYFSMVRNMLMEQEKNTNMSIENLTRERDSLKVQLKRSVEWLQRAQSKFGEMKVAIVQLKNRNSEFRKENEDLRNEKMELKRENEELKLKNEEYNKELVPKIGKLERDLAELFKFRDRHASRMARSSSPVVEVIEIHDDDENEANCNANADRVEAASNASEKDMMVILDQNQPYKKRSITDSDKCQPLKIYSRRKHSEAANTSTKRGKSVSIIETNENDDLPSGSGLLNDDDDDDSTESDDDSCSSSQLENLVEELISKMARQQSMNEMK